MATLKIHYDGWICLPTGLCQALGLNAGDRLAAELVEGELVLQPVAGRAGRSAGGDPDGTLPAKRKRGRPRKEAVAEPAAAVSKKRGRPRKVVAAAEPEPAADQPASREPWILRKKSDLPAPAPAMGEPAPPVRGPEWRSDNGSSFEERRPFRQVEVRKLGPGRGHNRPQSAARLRG
jgi:bifunctional DNA-binding transcriptional regulator/antitoxin component of YhaV-PrlF toxin-antitoxin module